MIKARTVSQIVFVSCACVFVECWCACLSSPSCFRAFVVGEVDKLLA